MNLIKQANNGLKKSNVGKNNPCGTYLPFRNKGNNFNYDYVAGRLLSHLIDKHLSKRFTLKDFEEECLAVVRKDLSEEGFIEHLRKMYFTGNDTLSRVAPEFLLLAQQKREKGASAHLSGIFANFLATNSASITLEGNPNFIEEMFLMVLNSYITPIPEKKGCDQAPYLPFIAQNFTNDLKFLCHKTDFLMQNFKLFLKLYNFLYCSQLALNIRDWPQGKEPKSKPLFFILDTEKASQERADVQNYGYKSLNRSVAHVFPILSMLEYLNKGADCRQPLWQFSAAIQQATLCSDVDELNDTVEVFSQEFFEARDLVKTYIYPDEPISPLRRLFQYAEDQFQSEKGDRKSIRNNYVKEFKAEVAVDFIQNRGRIGGVLVINQDYLLLLTNLIIGDQNKIHFQKLIHGFEARGIYFDKKSKNSLINFYDRVGNVDRLSDSGDAIYVRSTI